MKGLLRPRQAELLSQLAFARTLLAFDFDGTLAPIVAQRDGAKMRASTLALFSRVCELYPTAVISGRSRRDVLARLRGARVKYVVGNHGLEPSASAPVPASLMDEARTRLRALAATSRGIELEDKGYSLAVHYRQARNHTLAQTAILLALQPLSTPTRIIPGKCVLNVLPRNAPHKGDALLALRAEEGADVAVYVGDDITDEDVFAIDQPGRLLSVRVGKSAISAASYFLRDQLEMDELLRRLVRLRKKTPR